MLENKHNLTVDTQSKSIGNAFVEVVQNDNVALEVQIYNNNLLVDNTAYTYTLLSVLPSKERIIRQGSIGPNGYPVFNLGVEEMSETGIILAMVQVFDELGNRVTSYDFKYRMKEDLSTGGVVPSADNPKFVIITEDSLSQKADAASVYTKTEVDNLLLDKANKTQEDWIAPTLLNGWEEINKSGYMIDSLGFVHIKGEFKNGTVQTPIFILPESYRPKQRTVVTRPSLLSGASHTSFIIDRDGSVTCRSDVVLAGQVTFKAGV